MNVDLEAGGALATAGLAAHEIESEGGSNAGSETEPSPHPSICANCKAEVSGRYCSQCGQPAHVHRSLWHMLEEVLHGILHFDTKSWRTLPLLVFRPGVLTRRYIDGQRVRYVSPLALFLFCTFLMFFVLSLLEKPGKSFIGSSDSDRAQARAELVSAVEAAKKRVAKHTAALAVAADPSDREEIIAELRDATAEERVETAALSSFDAVTASANTRSPAAESKTPFAASDVNIEIGSARFDNAFKKAKSNPEFLAYKLKNTAYKFSFVLIPISLPFLWLMFFWRSGVTVYDHTVFSLYSLSFMSLFFVAAGLISTLPAIDSLSGYVFLIPPLHMFVQLRGTYGLTFGAALWRTFALLVVAGTVFVLFFSMVIAITMH